MPPQPGAIAVAEYDPAWPAAYAVLADLVRGALGDDVLALDHVGSTSVPGLAAKPIIDLDLTVADSTDESRYVPQLEAAGFTLVLRERAWHQHRLLTHETPRANLHVWSPDCPETVRHALLRDWLREHPEDREAYVAAKRTAADRLRTGGGGMATTTTSSRRRRSARSSTASSARTACSDRSGVRVAVDPERGDEVLVELEPDPVAGVDVGAVDPACVAVLRRGVARRRTACRTPGTGPGAVRAGRRAGRGPARSRRARPGRGRPTRRRSGRWWRAGRRGSAGAASPCRRAAAGCSAGGSRGRRSRTSSSPSTRASSAASRRSSCARPRSVRDQPLRSANAACCTQPYASASPSSSSVSAGSRPKRRATAGVSANPRIRTACSTSRSTSDSCVTTPPRVGPSAGRSAADRPAAT